MDNDDRNQTHGAADEPQRSEEPILDEVQIFVKAGAGGNGASSFRREAFVPLGGPDGGDGGRGGSVVFRADRGVSTFEHFRFKRRFSAQPGGPGLGKKKHGKRGKDLVLAVPLGTVVRTDAGLLADLTHHDERAIVARGGRGGLGNTHFKTSTNQAPKIAEKGEPGEELDLKLDLKTLADVGLVGEPNAGKSSLLAAVSAARPKIGAYPFTTLSPNLGVAEVGELRLVVADIPGLIEGAHAGVGLGHEFLRHVERTKVLVHLIEPIPADQSDPITNYRAIHEELRLYDESLITRPELVVVTKCELSEAADIADQLEAEVGQPVLRISAVTGKGLPDLINRVFDILKEVAVP